MKPISHLSLLACLLIAGPAISAQESSPGAGESTSASAPGQSPGVFLLTSQERGLPPELAPITKPWTGDFDGMVQRRMIRVLTVFQPGWYFLDGPSEKGLTFEITRQFESFINKKLDRGHLKVHVILIPVEFDQLQDALIEGYGDIIAAGYSITDTRREFIDFSLPVSKKFSEIIVSGPAAPTVTSLEGLSGQAVHARRASSHQESLRVLSDRLVDQGREPIKIQETPRHLDDVELLELVSAGVLPVIVMDSFKADFWSGIFTDIETRPDLAIRSDLQLAWGFRKNSPLLADSINEFVQENKQGTLMGNIIINRYLKHQDWVHKALNAEDMARFRTTTEWFSKYGSVYGFDPLLLAAQGYQESRLDQETRSAAGAIGIMQLLPSTAADPNVGITDIHEPEPNIHAGAKYMRFIRDRYFNDPAISDLNQTLFAFAAYNAGPARVRSLRKQASEAGLDGNVWFDHVERMAAREIGRETVQYVANIYKYYLAYTTLSERSMSRLDE